MNDIKITQKYNPETFLEELECIIPKEIFQKNFDSAVKTVSKDVSAPGFRKGHVPQNVVVKTHLQQISDKAINTSIDDALKSMKTLTPRPLEPLQVNSVKQEEDTGLHVVLTYIPEPSAELGKYDDIKVAESEAKKATDEEVEKEIGNMWLHYMQRLEPETKREDFTIDKVNAEFFEKTEIAKENPEMNSLEKVRELIKNYIDDTYARDALMKWEIDAQNEIIKRSTFNKVDAIIEKELNKRLENYKARFTQIGMDANDYMAKNELTDEALKNEWRPQAEKDIKLEILLQNIGKEQGIQATEEELEEQLKTLDPQTKKAYNNDENALKVLVNYYFVNQKAYEGLITTIKKNSGLIKEENTESKKEKGSKKSEK